MRRGEVLFPAGRRLLPQDVGLLAALGMITLPLFRQPQVAVISSGDEIVPVSETPAAGQVRDANAYLVAAQVQSAGGVPTLWGIVPDRFEAMRDTLAVALADADLVLISGGSVGTRDLTLKAIQDLPGAEILVHGVAIRPGKPTILAAIGGQPLLGLPPATPSTPWRRNTWPSWTTAPRPSGTSCRSMSAATPGRPAGS